jgi:hypothetical protein
MHHVGVALGDVFPRLCHAASPPLHPSVDRAQTATIRIMRITPYLVSEITQLAAQLAASINLFS